MAKKRDLAPVEDENTVIEGEVGAPDHADEAVSTDEKVLVRKRSVVVPLDVIEEMVEGSGEPVAAASLEDGAEEEKAPFGVPGAPGGLPPMVEDEEEEEPLPEEEESPEERRRRRRAQLLAELAALDAEEEEGKMIEVDSDMRFRLERLRGPLPASAKMVEIDSDMPQKLEELRKKRLANMGMKQEEIEGLGSGAYLCALTREIKSADAAPCEFCRGGCARENGQPGLLDIEAIAESDYKGVVVNSGYAPGDSLFLVDIKCEDGSLIEAIYTDAGKPAGWVLLDPESLTDQEEKALRESRRVVSMADAQGVATKAIEGTVVGVSAAIFEGYDVYAVEVEGLNGKSYDAYVALDGTLLGYDEYPEDTIALDVKGAQALAAEIEMKRAYSPEQRSELIEAGAALPDGSFAILDEGDLRNAILSVDRAENPTLARAHTMKRAIELEMENLIPPEWVEEKAESASGEQPETQDEGSDEVETKRFVSAEDREKYAKQGIALPDGSFPIANETDLRAAIHAVGRAKDVEKAKAHIRKRARVLGLESLLGPGILGRDKVLVDGSEDPSTLASLMEFELMVEEEGIETLGDN